MSERSSEEPLSAKLLREYRAGKRERCELIELIEALIAAGVLPEDGVPVAATPALRKIDAPEDCQLLTREDTERLAEDVRRSLDKPHAKILVTPPGMKFRRMSPYYVRERMSDFEQEIGFATHAEMTAYLEANKTDAPLIVERS